MPEPTINTDYFPANWYSEREGQPIVAIIAHGTVGTDSRAYLKRGGNLPDGSDRKVSVHVLIDKAGTIYRYVDEKYAANHAGFGTLRLNGKVYSPNGVNLNQVTLSYELENLQNGKDPYPDAQLWAMGWQIVVWRRLFGPLPLYRHADVDPARRSDTVGLTVAKMNAWATRVEAQSTPHGRYLIKGLPIYNDSQLRQPSGRFLLMGAAVTIDRVASEQPADYAASAGHVSDLEGGGFIDLNGGVKAP